MERIKRGNLRVDEINKSKKKKRKRLVILAVLLVLLMVGVIVIIRLQSMNFNSFEVIKTAELSDLTGSKFISYRGGALKANRDGTETISADGKQIWNVTYNMKDPIVDVNNSFAVIGDLNGKSAYIVNGSGVSNAIKTLYPIVDVQVAAQGVAALVLNNGTKDRINIYSMESTEEIAYVESVATKDGFPISIALSDDGRKLITSYVKAEADTITSQVTFHNFGDVGQNHTDNLVGTYNFSEFVPKVEFLTNDIAAIFLENGFWLYSIEEIPSEIAKISYDQRIQDIFYGQDYIGIVLEAQGSEASKLLMYDFSGSKIAERELSFSYEKIVSGEDYVVFYNNESCHVISDDGEDVFDDVFNVAVNQLLPGSSYKEFLAITDLGIDTMKMIETKEE
jgi:hypothetical protein